MVILAVFGVMDMIYSLIFFGHPSSEFGEEHKKHGVDNTNTLLSCNDWKQEKHNNIRNTLDSTLLLIRMDSVDAQTTPGGDGSTFMNKLKKLVLADKNLDDAKASNETAKNIAEFKSQKALRVFEL